ncbi:ABC transporter permease [Streptomyces ipomoeae]|uniref:ABC transporter permease n=1 Tax=Streptomyces ipomoeae TaxID=103232 RepID=UPI001146C1ED|nr:ABC transporter permease [Streptomyces ipomoeae]MDX2938889.1 ABC transporter permease [Streptomyces ipomoeae]TQE23626.1 ABC transporter permease [Streptomyces ipomoeae]
MSAATTTAAEAPTPPAPAAAHPAAPARPTRSLVRAMFRLHQSALWFWGLLVVLTAGALLWAAGPGVDAAWAEYLKSDCASADYCETGPAHDRYDWAVTLGTFALNIAPLLVGAWAGGALIGRELESGTARLAWTQSVRPAHWLAAKLAVPAALLISGTVLLTLLNRLLWSSDADIRQALGTRDWFNSSTFTAHGTLAAAYALLGLAVGTVAGLLIRRSLPALAVGVLATGTVMSTLESYRSALWPVETLVSKSGYPNWTGELVDRGLLTTSGDRLSDTGCTGTACGRTDVVGFYADFHPSSHFWPLQLVETGIALTITAALVYAAFRLLRRQTGDTARPTGHTPRRKGGTS